MVNKCTHQNCEGKSLFNHCCRLCNCCNNYPPNCCNPHNRFLCIHNLFNPPKPPSPRILQVETFQYTTVSDGEKLVYTNQDGIPEYASTAILNPKSVSYVNLFMNGMLQPPTFYRVEEGRVTLTDHDYVPEKGVPIILQFIKIIED